MQRQESAAIHLPDSSAFSNSSARDRSGTRSSRTRMPPRRHRSTLSLRNEDISSVRPAVRMSQRHTFPGRTLHSRTKNRFVDSSPISTMRDLASLMQRISAPARYPSSRSDGAHRIRKGQGSPLATRHRTRSRPQPEMTRAATALSLASIIGRDLTRRRYQSSARCRNHPLVLHRADRFIYAPKVFVPKQLRSKSLRKDRGAHRKSA